MIHSLILYVLTNLQIYPKRILHECLVVIQLIEMLPAVRTPKFHNRHQKSDTSIQFTVHLLKICFNIAVLAMARMGEM
jgi:hypothetical protein